MLTPLNINTGLVFWKLAIIECSFGLKKDSRCKLSRVMEKCQVPKMLPCLYLGKVAWDKQCSFSINSISSGFDRVLSTKCCTDRKAKERRRKLSEKKKKNPKMRMFQCMLLSWGAPLT